MVDSPAEPDGDARERARSFAVNSLAARAQSVAEIRAKLVRRGFASDVVETTIEEAVRLRCLDDTELAERLAHDLRGRGYGRRRAALALRRRGLEAFADTTLDEVYGNADEAALASAALGRRRVDDERERQRAVAYLVRRGFSTSVAWNVVRGRRAERED